MNVLCCNGVYNKERETTQTNTSDAVFIDKGDNMDTVIPLLRTLLSHHKLEVMFQGIGSV